MAGMIDRDEITRGLLKVGVEPPAWLDEWLADSEKGLEHRSSNQAAAGSSV